MLSDPKNLNEATIPCQICSRATTMLGTKRCDLCWQLEYLIDEIIRDGNFYILERILQEHELKLDFIRYGEEK